MIATKHLKPARKADKRQAAMLPTTGKKALEPVTKVTTATKAAAENRNPPGRWGVALLRPTFASSTFVPLGKTLAVMQVSGGSQSFSTVN